MNKKLQVAIFIQLPHFKPVPMYSGGLKSELRKVNAIRNWNFFKFWFSNGKGIIFPMVCTIRKWNKKMLLFKKIDVRLDHFLYIVFLYLLNSSG